MASNDTCPVCRTAEIVCGKWTLLVIRDLAEGRSRFCELERSLQGISPRTLSLRLRALEEEGIVERQTFPEVPPRVEYALTEKGRALVPLIEDMRTYGLNWLGGSCDDIDRRPSRRPSASRSARRPNRPALVRIAVSADELTGVAQALPDELRRRGHEPILHGALSETERPDWAWASETAARDVADGRAEQAVVACWTGTGASIAANKVAGIRAALCVDAATADGARRWNDANVLALSLRLTSPAQLEEILDAWFGGDPSEDASDQQNIEHLVEIERS